MIVMASGTGQGRQKWQKTRRLSDFVSIAAASCQALPSDISFRGSALERTVFQRNGASRPVSSRSIHSPA